MRIQKVYLKPGKRMGVQLQSVCGIRDIQQDMPVAWCSACGAEIFSPRKPLCRRCEGGGKNEKMQSLYKL